MSEEIHWDLARNGFDFLDSAIANIKLRDECERCLKYAVLHLGDAVELLLKRCLEREHWTLVLENIDKTSPDALASGDFKSVAWDQLIERIEKLAIIIFAKPERDFLRRLRSVRNQIRHFEVHLSKEQAVALVAEGIQFCLRIAEKPLKEDGLDEDAVREIHADLKEFDKFVVLRMKDIEERHKALIKIPCPTCKQMALVADDGEARCLFCGFAEDGETAASSWVYAFGPHVRPGEEAIYGLTHQCPDCGTESLVEIGRYWETPLSAHFYCFSCGEFGLSPESYSACLRCGRLFAPGSEDETVCRPCFSEAMSKDD